MEEGDRGRIDGGGVEGSINGRSGGWRASSRSLASEDGEVGNGGGRAIAAVLGSGVRRPDPKLVGPDDDGHLTAYVTVVDDWTRTVILFQRFCSQATNYNRE